jgi:hypothetical protein
MADISDVETAMVGVIAGSLGLPTPYSMGSLAASPVAGVSLTVARGWPTKSVLTAALAAGQARVTVFPVANMTRLTSRYPLTWQTATDNAPTLTTTQATVTVTFGGSGGGGQVAGVLVGPGNPPTGYSYRLTASDTPATVATAFAALIPGASASGPVLTIGSGTLINAAVVADQTAWRETRRQEVGIAVTCWCPTPASRDAIGTAVDAGFANLTDAFGNLTQFMPLPDGSAARLRYNTNHTDDAPDFDGLWRRDLRYMAEYPTAQTLLQPEMLFLLGTLAPASNPATKAPFTTKPGT